jgi:DNA-directed RNA polymerase specialized sigma subunit
MTATDLDLWHQHKQGDREATNQLLGRLAPHISSRADLYRNVPIPAPAIRGYATRVALHALDTYDPKAGTQLSTHVVNRLQRVSRFVNQNKNVARIPEHRFLRVGTYQSVHSSLSAQLGRSPSIEELSDDLGWTHREVQAMGSSLRSDLAASSMPETMEGRIRDRGHETMHFVRGGLTPPEKDAFDHLWQFSGKPNLSVAEISKRTGLSTDRIYRLKRESAQEIQRNL